MGGRFIVTPFLSIIFSTDVRNLKNNKYNLIKNNENSFPIVFSLYSKYSGKRIIFIMYRSRIFMYVPFHCCKQQSNKRSFFIVLIFGQQTEIAPLTSYPYNVSRYCATSGMLTFTSPQSTGMHSGGVFVHFSPSQVLFGVLKRESLLLRYLIINEEFSSFEILHPDRSRCVGTNEHVDCRHQH